jgi:hypothetical protein
MTEFSKFPKIPRFNREWIITEKIDGTNAAVVIEKYDIDTPADALTVALANNSGETYVVHAQSRNRLITPQDDNFGFAAWVRDNAHDLVEFLGEGTHFGEWAGPGIQKNPHELTRRHFFLFDVRRWLNEVTPVWSKVDLAVVPYFGSIDNLTELERDVEDALFALEQVGSYASLVAEAREVRGKAEGVIVYSTAAQQPFKITLENDEKPKSAVTA